MVTMKKNGDDNGEEERGGNSKEKGKARMEMEEKKKMRFAEREECHRLNMGKEVREKRCGGMRFYLYICVHRCVGMFVCYTYLRTMEEVHGDGVRYRCC